MSGEILVLGNRFVGNFGNDSDYTSDCSLGSDSDYTSDDDNSVDPTKMTLTPSKTEDNQDNQDNQDNHGDLPKLPAQQKSWLVTQWTTGWVCEGSNPYATALKTALWAPAKFLGLLLITPFLLPREIMLNCCQEDLSSTNSTTALYGERVAYGTGGEVGSLVFGHPQSGGSAPLIPGALVPATTKKTEVFTSAQKEKRAFFVKLLLAEMGITFKLDRFGRPKTLGEGGCGKVYKCVDEKENHLAFKETHPRIFNDEKGRKLFVGNTSPEKELKRGEGLALGIPDHRNVVKTHGFILKNNKTQEHRLVTELGPKKADGADDWIVGIFIEVVSNCKELADIYDSRWGGLSEEKIINYCYQAGAGLVAVHDAGYVHRDVKLENLLLDTVTEIVKLADFGFLKTIKRGRTNTRCASPLYAAPELWSKLGEHDIRVDSWAFGIVLYVLAFREFPFFGMDKQEVEQLVDQFIKSGDTIKSRKKSLLYGRSSMVDNKDLWDLLNKLICHEDKRITVREALEHKFFASYSGPSRL